MKRYKPNQKKAKKQFTRTASTAHKRNFQDRDLMRGGNRM